MTSGVPYFGKFQVREADVITGDDLVPRPEPRVPGDAPAPHALHEDPWLFRRALADATAEGERKSRFRGL